MAYLKPPALTRRVVNPLVGRLRVGRVELLRVRGRRTGATQSVPVVPVLVDGHRYLVAPYGESDWVRNLRAAGEAELDGRHGPAHVRADEVAVADRGRVIDAYRRATGRTVQRCFDVLPDPRDHPVFEIHEGGS
ncbi:hypothetical protein GCM10027517_13030 [Phycicoccus ginsengisoli]